MELVPRRPVKFNICSSPAHLPIVRAAMEEMCKSLGLDSDAAGAVVLSVDEALTNIIRHAYQDDNDQPIEIEVTPVGHPEPQALKICLSDRGRHVDSTHIKSRSLAEVRPGGLGVHIIAECMDQVEYRPRDGGGTVLTMTKRLQPKDAKESKEVSS